MFCQRDRLLRDGLGVFGFADSAQAPHLIAQPVKMRYYLSMDTRRKKMLSPEPLKVCSLKVTPTAEQFLRQLSQEASDALGWTVSNSALFRALLSYMEQQPRSWAMTALYPHIEQEIARGRVWGKKKQ